MRAEARAALPALLLVLLAASPGGAQVGVPRQRAQLELRADGFASDPYAAHLGAGVGVRLGYYARLVLAGGAGASGGWEWGDATRASGRVELLARFVADPFRERARGPYAAAGLVHRLEQGAPPRTRLTAVVGVEGQARGGWLPAVEAGFGGGLRAGLVLRRAPADGR